MGDVLGQVGIARDQGGDPDGPGMSHVEVLEVDPLRHDGADDTGVLAHHLQTREPQVS